MWHSKIINFCFWILPFNSWKDFLLGRHIEKCPSCLKSLASQEEARSILIQAEEVQNLEVLWLDFLGKLKKEKEKKVIRQRKPGLKLKWQWAAGLATVLLAVAINFWFFQGNKLEKIQEAGEIIEHESFELYYVKIESEPARTFVFQPHDSKVIIVWAEKNI